MLTSIIEWVKSTDRLPAEEGEYLTYNTENDWTSTAEYDPIRNIWGHEAIGQLGEPDYWAKFPTFPEAQ